MVPYNAAASSMARALMQTDFDGWSYAFVDINAMMLTPSFSTQVDHRQTGE
jgi:hypothetical protein